MLVFRQSIGAELQAGSLCHGYENACRSLRSAGNRPLRDFTAGLTAGAG
jgi:hypothetical protein